MKCKKHDKVYDVREERPHGSWQNWICRKCGEKGVEEYPPAGYEYERLCKKWAKKSK